MTRVTQLQTNFASGELDPTLRGQKDIDAYKNGAKRCRNVQRRSTGGMERRPGTYDLAELEGEARLETFEFSADQRYGLSFTDARVDIFDVDGNVFLGIIGAPWDSTSLWEMTTTQLGDVMVISHVDFPPQVLTRTGAYDFTLGDVAYDQSPNGDKVYQPYYKFVDPNITLTPSAATGAITLTASGAFFDAAHVGARIRIYDAECEITAVTDSTHASANVYGELKGKLDLDPLKATRGSTSLEVLHLFHGLATGATITLSGCNTTGSIPGDQIDGAHVVTVLDEHRYKFTLSSVSYNYWEDTDGDGTPTSNAYTAARLSEDGGGPNVEYSVAGTATRAWLEPSFSGLRGYPGACCFHEGRLWLGGSEQQPDGAWGSNALQNFRFDSGKGYDADSVQVATGTEDISRTRHLISNGELFVLNANGVSAFIVRDGEPITPNNARIKGQSDAGCSYAQPTVFDGAVLFASANGLSIYELVFSANDGSYTADPISTLASHLVRSPRSIAATPGTTSKAEQFCFFANADDGTLTVFHSLRKENIAGWVLWELGEATVHSVATVGPYVYFAVTAHGRHRLYRLADSDAACLDGCVVHEEAAPTTDWILDARVRGRTVHLVSELGYHDTVEVPATGEVTLDVAVTRLTAGDAFYAEIETLPPSVQMPTGPRDGMIKRVVRSLIDFGDDTLGAEVEGYAVPMRMAGDAPSAAVRAVTSPYEMGHLGCERDPTLTIGQSAPLAPWRVLSVLQEVEV